MNFKKTIIIILLLTLVICSSTSKAAPVKVPAKMKPNTSIVYNNDLSFNILNGGKNGSAEESDVIARPGMKVVYEKDGTIRNAYYLVDGYYQLKEPAIPGLLKNGSGLMARGSGKHTYGNCSLYFGQSNIEGWGRITYYGKPDHPDKKKFIGDHKNYLKVGDCATKMYYDDIPYGTKVIAKNRKNNKKMTFIKNDVGGLPNAILDIFEDGKWSLNGIRGLTVNKVKDSVDEGYIKHNYN